MLRMDYEKVPNKAMRAPGESFDTKQ